MADDAHEFASFVRSQSRQLLRAGWLLTSDWVSAEDLVQTALTVMWQHWDALRRPDARPAYARRVLMTTFLDSRRRRWIGELPTSSLPDHAAIGDLSDAVADGAVMVAALDNLPARQRAVVVLCYFDDLTEQGAAEALGCSVGTVKSQKSRALRTLRSDLDLRALFADGRY